MHVWNVLRAAWWKYRMQKNHHLGSIAQLCPAISSQLRLVSTTGKNMLNSNISSICPHNMVNFQPLTAENCWRVWGTPANFNGFRVLALLLHRRRSMEVNKTAGCLAMSWAGTLYVYIHFGGSCPLTEFCQLQNSLCIQVLRSPILPALLHSTRAVAVSQTLWHGTKNGITELSQRAPPIFGWVVIALGTGPHSSYEFFFRI